MGGGPGGTNPIIIIQNTKGPFDLILWCVFVRREMFFIIFFFFTKFSFVFDRILIWRMMILFFVRRATHILPTWNGWFPFFFSLEKGSLDWWTVPVFERIDTNEAN
jgi:hypothetical protein